MKGKYIVNHLIIIKIFVSLRKQFQNDTSQKSA